jgi:subtilase family serine protease
MRRSSRVIALVLGLTVSMAACTGHSSSPLPSTPMSRGGQVQAAVPRGNDVGKAEYSQGIDVTVYLKLRDAAAFSRRVDALYDPSSPTFRHWLTDAQLERYAPPRRQMNAVREALARQGLTILSTDRDGFSIRARGTVSRVARAFNTQIHNFTSDGQTFRAPITEPRLSGPAEKFVDAVVGLNDRAAHTFLAFGRDPQTMEPYPAVNEARVEAAGGLKSVITNQILSASTTQTFKNPHGKYPRATYSGVVYAANPNLVPDFTARDLQQIYGLTADYAQGLNGAGQTVVLLEAYDYSQAESDANHAAKLMGLPPLTSANFQVVYPAGKPNPKFGVQEGWNGEEALDIQSAHSIAPGAKIVVVVANGQDSEALQYAMQYIIDHRLGYSVSDSWGVDTDLDAGPQELKSYEDVLIRAAAKGVSFQFSSGDSSDSQFNTPIGNAQVPADSPHATAVGGTSVLNDVRSSGFFSVGWGDDIVILTEPQTGPMTVFTPNFKIGGGGGSSVHWPKPKWQSAAPGTYRQTPDVSALADPFTGIPVVLTQKGHRDLLLEIGGTSLASPIFSALWAIAQQKAGHPLGQAAPTLARMQTGLTDVVQTHSPLYLRGSITTKKGTTAYSARNLFWPWSRPTRGFVAALFNFHWQSGSVTTEGWAFGLDRTLVVRPGWDDVTGFGTPNASFVTSAAGI